MQGISNRFSKIVGGFLLTSMVLGSFVPAGFAHATGHAFAYRSFEYRSSWSVGGRSSGIDWAWDRPSRGATSFDVTYPADLTKVRTGGDCHLARKWGNPRMWVKESGTSVRILVFHTRKAYQSGACAKPVTNPETDPRATEISKLTLKRAIGYRAVFRVRFIPGSQ